jgi:uncharacterized membrane protein YcaP (DUF421 family)
VSVLVTAVPLAEIVFRTIVVYAVLLGLLRIAGKRELGQMSVTDLVVILVIANAVQNSLNAGDVSLVGGLVSAATLIVMNVLLDRFGRRIPLFRRFVIEQPTLLLRDGELIAANLEREDVSREDIEMSAREHGIAELSEVSAAVLEPDGSISIIPRQGSGMHRSSRRIRQFRQRP